MIDCDFCSFPDATVRLFLKIMVFLSLMNWIYRILTFLIWSTQLTCPSRYCGVPRDNPSGKESITEQRRLFSIAFVEHLHPIWCYSLLSCWLRYFSVFPLHWDRSITVTRAKLMKRHIWGSQIFSSKKTLTWIVGIFLCWSRFAKRNRQSQLSVPKIWTS